MQSDILFLTNVPDLCRSIGGQRWTDGAVEDQCLVFTLIMLLLFFCYVTLENVLSPFVDNYHSHVQALLEPCHPCVGPLQSLWHLAVSRGV